MEERNIATFVGDDDLIVYIGQLIAPGVFGVSRGTRIPPEARKHKGDQREAQCLIVNIVAGQVRPLSGGSLEFLADE